MQRLLAGRAGVINFTNYSDDGVATDSDNPSHLCNVRIEDVNGFVVVATTAATRDSAGKWHYDVPASITEDLGTYTAYWTYLVSAVAQVQTTQFDTCSTYLFDIPELRALDVALANTTAYPAETIRAARVNAEERIEKAAGLAFAQRGAQAVLTGDYTTRLVLPHVEVREILGVSIDGDDLTEAELDELVLLSADGVLIHPSGWPDIINGIVIDYVHGLEVVPAPVKRATMLLAFEALVPSSTSPRATSQSTDLGEFRISIANYDAGRETGIPEVDAVIASFGRRRPAVG